jgi:enoyl-CoA hydratase/carnithine racemase
MMVSGDPIRADEALKSGLIDEIVEGRPHGRRRRVRREGAEREAAAPEDPAIWTTSWPPCAANRRSSPTSANRVARQTRGFKAPENIVKAVKRP